MLCGQTLPARVGPSHALFSFAIVKDHTNRICLPQKSRQSVVENLQLEECKK